MHKKWPFPWSYTGNPTCLVVCLRPDGTFVELYGYDAVPASLRSLRRFGYKPLYVVRPKEAF
jgi:hypothetical protein